MILRVIGNVTYAGLVNYEITNLIIIIFSIIIFLVRILPNQSIPYYIGYLFIGQFQCAAESCQFLGDHRQEMINHYKISGHADEFSCDSCGKSFGDNFSLRNHSRVHSGEKPYKCKWTSCKYATTQKGAIITHIRMVFLHLTFWHSNIFIYCLTF